MPCYVKLKSMFTEKCPPPQRRKIRPSQAQRVTPAQYKKETALALPSTTSQQTTSSNSNINKQTRQAHEYLAQVATEDKFSFREVENFLNNVKSDDGTRSFSKRENQIKVLLDSGANFWAFDQHDTQMKILDQHNPISALEPSGNAIRILAEAM